MKTCYDCGVELTVGLNWTEARKRNKTYCCSTCTYKRCKAWREKNRERNILNAARQRAEKENLPFDLSEEDIVIPTTCPALGIQLQFAEGKGHYTDNSPSLDKIIPSLGYVRGNVAVISMKANRIKNNATVEDLERVLNWLKRTHETTN